MKEANYENTIKRLREILREAFTKYHFLKESDLLLDGEKEYFNRILNGKADDVEVTSSLYHLSDFFLCLDF